VPFLRGPLVVPPVVLLPVRPLAVLPLGRRLDDVRAVPAPIAVRVGVRGALVPGAVGVVPPVAAGARPRVPLELEAAALEAVELVVEPVARVVPLLLVDALARLVLV